MKILNLGFILWGCVAKNDRVVISGKARKE